MNKNYRTLLRESHFQLRNSFPGSLTTWVILSRSESLLHQNLKTPTRRTRRKKRSRLKKLRSARIWKLRRRRKKKKRNEKRKKRSKDKKMSVSVDVRKP